MGSRAGPECVCFEGCVWKGVSALGHRVCGLAPKVRCLGPGSQAEVCSEQLAAGRVSTRVRARHCACCPPGSPVLLQSVSMTRRSRAPQAARGGDERKRAFLRLFCLLSLGSHSLLIQRCSSLTSSRLLHTPTPDAGLVFPFGTRRTRLSLFCQRESQESR